MVQLSINDVAAAYKEVYGKELPSKCLGSIDDLAEELSRRMQADPSAWQICVPLMYQRVVFDGSAKLQHVANDRCGSRQTDDMTVGAGGLQTAGASLLARLLHSGR